MAACLGCIVTFGSGVGILYVFFGSTFADYYFCGLPSTGVGVTNFALGSFNYKVFLAGEAAALGSTFYEVGVFETSSFFSDLAASAAALAAMKAALGSSSLGV